MKKLFEQDTAAGDGKTNLDKLIKDGGDDPAKFAKTFIAYLEREMQIGTRLLKNGKDLII